MHENADLTSIYDYRVLALGGEGQVAASNLQGISFEYPDAPENPVMKRVSVLDPMRIELILGTDTAAEETSLYEFQRWDATDSVWRPISSWYPAHSGYQVTHVDDERNTDEFSYKYRAVAYNVCEAQVAQSQEAESILLRVYPSTTPGQYENSLIWTAYNGFANGLDRYEVLRKQTNNEGDPGSPLATVQAGSENHEDNIGDELDTPGIFCYRVLALEQTDSNEVLQGAASNWVCLTEDPIVWLPTAFSPNDDDLNDWYPWAPGEAELGFLGEPRSSSSNFRMSIVSRWGTLMYQTESVEEPWDGKVDGKPAPSGMYVAHVQYLDGAGAWRRQSISVTVLAGN